ncbi:MAG: hypothetical protein Unbinned2026contig1000_31 [Prokaryotic dsDNA virus sp.]|nr:MAG: hypothetical protein Unbinned2026contig1000_31 [Prokaryotic dsDNA virus sp.]
MDELFKEISDSRRIRSHGNTTYLKDGRLFANEKILRGYEDFEKIKQMGTTAGNILKGTPDFLYGGIKSIPGGIALAGEETFNTLLPFVNNNVMPWLSENVPGYNSINEYLNDALAPEGKAQEIGGAFGTEMGRLVAPGAVYAKGIKALGYGKNFLANVLGYGTAEFAGMKPEEEGLIEMGIQFFVQNDELQKAMLQSISADEDMPFFLQKLQKAPQRYFEGGLLGEGLEQGFKGLGVLYNAVKGSPNLKATLETIGTKAQESLDASDGTTLSALGVGEMDKAINTQLAKLAPNNQELKTEGGIDIVPEKGAENLRLHLQRIESEKAYPGGPKNERTVIKAPNDNLPDIAIGNITFDDWIKRVEKTSSPEQIMKDAKWYDEVFGEFEQVSEGNKELTDRLATAWFSVQQNESPANAMQNVLFIYEQFKRGVPLEEVKGKGLPMANKIGADIIYGKEVTAGAGQKIADFIDSGYTKDVRSIMGNAPEGGSPFVIDIHSARETGLVDEIYINHLKRLGYEVPNDIIIDVGGGGIKGPMYENRAIFGRELTDHLNSINWMGKSDWKPREIQAIGWNNLTRLTGDVQAGGNIDTALSRNLRRISMEVDPGKGSPWAKEFGEDYNNLPDEDKFSINERTTSKAIEIVSKRTGVDLYGNVHGTGGWELYQNPSTVMEGFISHDTAVETASRLGYMLNQTEVWVNSAKTLTKNPKHFSVDIVETGSTNLRNSETLKELFEKIVEADPNGLFRGYQPIMVNGKPGIKIIIDKDAIKRSPLTIEQAKNYIIDFVSPEGKLTNLTNDLNFDVNININESELTKLGNNWTKDNKGGSYKSNIGNIRGSSSKVRSRTDLDTDGEELTNFFRQEIENAKSKDGPSGGPTGQATGSNQGITAYSGSGADFKKFSIEKVGTGQGETNFGYGLYFDANEDIATFFKGEDGKTYKVNLNVKDTDLIDVETSFSQQPDNVQNALRKYYDEYGISEDQPVSDLIEAMPNNPASVNYGKTKEFAQDMNSQGLKGLRYKTLSHPTKKTPSDTFVVFDDKVIEILEKYGIVGPVLLSAGASKQGEQGGN